MTVSAVMPSKNNAALPESRRPSDSEALPSEEADLRNRQDPVSATAVAGIAKLSAEPLRPQQVALATNSQNDYVKFFTDVRTGIIFAIWGAYAGIIINKSTGVPLAEGLSITPGTFGKDVAIIPISNFNPSSLVGNDRIAKTAVQIGLNEATAVAGIQAAHLLQKTSLPVTAPPGTTKKIIYLASAFVPLALEGKKDVVDYLKKQGLINDSGKPGTRVEDWGQWTAKYVPDSVAIGTGVSAAVAPTLAFNSIKDALKNGQPLDARLLFKSGVNGVKGSGLGFAVPILQSLFANAAVNYPGATNSAVVDGVVNGVTGQSITNLSKKIFTDPKQRQAVTEIKDQARFRQLNGEAAGDARYGTKTEQALANSATAKQDAAALKKLPLGQKLENIRGQTGQYGRSVLIGVAIEVAPHYLSVEYNLNSRINNRSVRDMSPHQAADTVKAIDEVLRNPLVGDGKAISNVVINLGKLIGKDLSKINLWGSPEFINNLNARKAQIYQKYPNLDLNAPAQKNDTGQYSSAGAAYKPKPRNTGDEGTAATQRANNNQKRENNAIKNAGGVPSAQDAILQEAIRRANSSSPPLRKDEVPDRSGPGPYISNTPPLTPAQEKQRDRQEIARAQQVRREVDAGKPTSYDAFAASQPPPANFNTTRNDDFTSAGSRTNPRQSEIQDRIRVDDFGKPTTSKKTPIISVISKENQNFSGPSPYQANLNSQVALYLKRLVPEADFKNPNPNTFKGEAVVALTKIVQNLSQTDIEKILKLPINTPSSNLNIHAIKFGNNTSLTNLGKGIILISTGIRNSNDDYVSIRVQSKASLATPGK